MSHIDEPSLSNCCKAPVMTTGADEKTEFYFRCTKCGKPGPTHKKSLSMIKDEIKDEIKKKEKRK